MKKKIFVSISFCVLFTACSGIKTVDDKGRPLPVTVKYSAGEITKYRMNLQYFEDGKLKYTSNSRAVVMVSSNATGTFYEEFRWVYTDRNGKKAKLSPDFRYFSHNLSLDPAFKLHMPDISKAGPFTQPVTDTLAFYADLMLAIRKAMPLKAGEKLSVRHGEPNSWAGGPIKVGFDCMDFELTMVKVASDYAVLRVAHIPSGRVCGKPPGPSMRKSVEGVFMNWYQVASLGDANYAAAWAKENFENEIKFSLRDGRIISASRAEIVAGWRSYCLDPGLVNCGNPEEFEITRKIIFTRE